MVTLGGSGGSEPAAMLCINVCVVEEGQSSNFTKGTTGRFAVVDVGVKQLD